MFLVAAAQKPPGLLSLLRLQQLSASSKHDRSMTVLAFAACQLPGAVPIGFFAGPC